MPRPSSIDKAAKEDERRRKKAEYKRMKRAEDKTWGRSLRELVATKKRRV